MFLLGYGLIEFPRSFWDMANHEKYLSQIQLKASTQFKDIADAQLNVSLCVSDVLKTKEHIASYPDPELQEAMRILASGMLNRSYILYNYLFYLFYYYNRMSS